MKYAPHKNETMMHFDVSFPQQLQIMYWQAEGEAPFGRRESARGAALTIFPIYAHGPSSLRAPAFPRRLTPEFAKSCPSENRGRRESRMLCAPAASRPSEKRTRVSHHRFAETIRPSLRDWF